MGLIKLNRFSDPTGCVFDPMAVVEKARNAFLNIQVVPGDALATSAANAAAQGAPEHIVRTLRQNQQDFGPAFAFEIGIAGGQSIQGRARRYDVTFLFSDPLPQEWRQRLLAFLQELGAGKIEEIGDKSARLPWR